MEAVNRNGIFRSETTFGTVASMLPKVYIETTIVSYLTGRPSREVVAMGHQQVTRDWWEKDRYDYELYTSEVVIAEAERGDPDAARARLSVLAPLRRLSATSDSEAMVPILLRETRLPADALLDMSHVSIATVHGMQYLLTWNCRHIANARIVRIVERICRNLGFEPPVLCTPDELMGSDMREEPVVDETHRVRREISAQFHDDVHAFFEYLRQREAERPEQVVTLERVQPDTAAAVR